MKKNIKKISNYSLAILLGVGVILLSFVAYKQKIQADTIVPGYATVHLNIHITVPTIESVPFKVTFLPQSASKRFYFKARRFELNAAGLNTIDWYIRKIPQGNYKVILESETGVQVPGSSQIISLNNDQVTDANSFDLNLGEPVATPTPSPADNQDTEPDEDYNQEEVPGESDFISDPTPTPQPSGDGPPSPPPINTL